MPANVAARALAPSAVAETDRHDSSHGAGPGAALAAIAWRAETLHERLHGGPVASAEAKAACPEASRRLRHWCDVVGRGDPDLLEQRLLIDRVDPTTALAALGQRIGPAPTRFTPPAWIEILERCIVSPGVLSERDRLAQDPDDPVPFEDLLLHFVRVARTELEESAGNDLDRLGPDAQRSLERSLLRWLSLVSAPVLELELAAFKASRRSGLDLALGSASATGSDLYRQLVAGLDHERLLAFFVEYSALARLISTLITTWVDACWELISRLERDEPALQRAFGISTALGQVVTLTCPDGDRHRGGRRVLILHLACGLVIAYKPRQLGLDRALYDMLGWCTDRGLPLGFRRPRTVDCGTHGWMEYVPAASCSERAEVGSFYRRAGSLLCLLWVLGATDIHLGNIIASGEHPVPIDLETLLQPRLPEMESVTHGSGAQVCALQRLRASALQTGLLPRWHLRDEHTSHDLTGLGGGEPQDLPGLRRVWHDVNRDTMSTSAQPLHSPPGSSLPRLDGIDQPLAGYEDDLVEGFSLMYRFLKRHRAEILSPEGPLAVFSGARVRFLLRPTQVYSVLLRRSIRPELLREGVDRSIELEALYRAVIAAAAPGRLGPVASAEIEALEACDIPLLDACSDDSSLALGNGLRIETILDGTGLERATTTLEGLDDAGLSEQVELIRAAVWSRFADDLHGSDQAAPGSAASVSRPATARTSTPTAPWPRPAADGPDRDRTRSRAALIEATLGLLSEVARRAVVAQDGSATWIVPCYTDSAGRFQLAPIGPGIYDGVGGIALALAAAGRVCGAAWLQEMTAGAVQTLLAQASRPPGTISGPHPGLGGASGLGSTVYALTRLGQVLARADLLDAAEHAASQITPELISADHSLDLLSGTAGAALSLLALHSATGSALAAERAAACGRRLLEIGWSREPGSHSWCSRVDRRQLGLAHGASGIALALVGLHRLTADPRMLDAADRAFGFERRRPDPRPLHRSGLEPGSSASGRDVLQALSWCRGAAGIALARVAALPVLDSPEIRDELDAAIAAASVLRPDQVETLCCGALGQVEAVATCGLRLHRPELTHRALDLAGSILERARSRGSFRWRPAGFFNPGLLQGAAGIAYGLLRLAEPTQAPAILLWE